MLEKTNPIVLQGGLIHQNVISNYRTYAYQTARKSAAGEAWRSAE